METKADLSMFDVLVALDRTMQDAARTAIVDCLRYEPLIRARRPPAALRRVDGTGTGTGTGKGQGSDGAATQPRHAASSLTPVVMACWAPWEMMDQGDRLDAQRVRAAADKIVSDGGRQAVFTLFDP